MTNIPIIEPASLAPALDGRYGVRCLGSVEAGRAAVGMVLGIGEDHYRVAGARKVWQNCFGGDAPPSCMLVLERVDDGAGDTEGGSTD